MIVDLILIGVGPNSLFYKKVILVRKLVVLKKKNMFDKQGSFLFIEINI